VTQTGQAQLDEIDQLDEKYMRRAVELGAAARTQAHPNPWVGAVLVLHDSNGTPVVIEGATEPDGGRHAEAVVLAKAPQDLSNATLYVTLEPCCEFPSKRTPACVGALLERNLKRVVIALQDPDSRVDGQSLAALREAGVQVDVGLLADEVVRSLEPYVHHRTTGRPYVVLKLAASLDGRTAAPDGTSQWITGPVARTDAHQLRADSDAILVGAGTVRTDNPSLTTRLVPGRDPRRIVLGGAALDAAIHPCTELSGDLGAVLDQLGSEGVVQLLVEGGATVAQRFHRSGLVDRYVLYLAPALFGGDDAAGLFRGPGVASMSHLWRGRIVGTNMLGDDIRVDLVPGPTTS
jgi:diaminohydroxyphosphoribosylaminopyrimidine deaminase / 5-amino-6-(5-phosphoribosylamino)uracil reductase